MQYATESKLYFTAYNEDGTKATSLRSNVTAFISQDGSNLHWCTNRPVSVAGSGWFCLTLTAAEMTCDTFVIQINNLPSGVTVPDIVGEPQRVTPSTDTSNITADLAAIKGLAGNFSVTSDVLTAYNDDGTTNAVYDLTRDQSGNITAIEPRSAT